MTIKRRPSRVEICYLCGKKLDGFTDRDHVPPDRWFAKQLKSKFAPQLITLRVHRACQEAFVHDEEYLFNTLLPLAIGSPAADAALADLAGSFKYPEQRALGLKVLAEFGTVRTADGKIVKAITPSRVNRVAWKVVRGLFFVEYDHRVLPEHTPHAIEIFGPEEATSLPDEFAFVRDTPARARYGGVFDYKFNVYDCTDHPEDPGFKLHYWALLLWDRIILTIAFHDPSCGCAKCKLPAPVENPG